MKPPLDSDAALRERDKLDALARLSGGVAHDFNNLLTVILSYVAMLKEAPSASREELCADLDAIEDAARQAIDLTGALAAFGRRQSSRPIALNLAEYLPAHAAELKEILGARIALRMRHGDAVPLVPLDPAHAARLLKELAKNAKDAMPDGGIVTLRTERVGGSVQLSFSDEGRGISAETRARLFEPFFTTKGRGQGRGLGLAVVYGIVLQNGGAITVESAEGAGTTFRIVFPAEA